MEINGFKIDKFNVHGFNVGNKTTGKETCLCVFCSKDRKPSNQKLKVATVYFDTAYYKCNHCGEDRRWRGSTSPPAPRSNGQKSPGDAPRPLPARPSD